MLTDIMDLNSKLILGKMETIKQLKKIILLSFMLLSYSTLKAQKVFTVDADWKADVKVYVVDTEWKADLLVFKVDANWKAGKNDGKWFFTNADWKAEKKVYFVDADWKADLKIYFVYSDWKAKWVDKSKISLMY